VWHYWIQPRPPAGFPANHENNNKHCRWLQNCLSYHMSIGSYARCSSSCSPEASDGQRANNLQSLNCFPSRVCISRAENEWSVKKSTALPLQVGLNVKLQKFNYLLVLRNSIYRKLLWYYYERPSNLPLLRCKKYKKLFITSNKHYI
jgi:hypothetical protein